MNGKSLNVSVTVSFWTDEIRRHALVNTANGVMRHVMGLNPRSRAISGPSYWWRAGLAAAWKASGLSKRFREKYKSEFKINQATRSKQAFKEAAE